MKNLKLYLSAFFLYSIIASTLNEKSFGQTIAGDGGHCLAICNNKVWAWGYNFQGELGNGSNYNSNIPVPVNSLTDVTAVAVGYYHSLAIKNDSTVWAWGAGRRLGTPYSYNSNVDSNVPVPVSFLTSIIAIAGGWGHSLAIKNDGTVWAWGEGGAGQLGNGANGASAASYTPIQVSSLTGIIAVATGYYHSLALKNGGTVWAWGHNSDGQLGTGNNTDTNVPVQVNSLSGIIAIATESWHSLALKNDGTVWAWGKNEYGQLGIGNDTSTNIPVQVSSLTGITAIAAAFEHSVALKMDGTVWAWGRNEYGQLGNGTNSDSWIPMQINSLAGITSISGGVLALKNDGTLWAWGGNFAGQLGNGTNTASNIPVQVIGLCQELTTGVKEVAEKETEMNVFPNPANNSVTITISTNKLKEEFILKVSDSLDKTVYSETLKDITGSFTKQIDLSKFPKGIYFIELQPTSTNSPQKKVEVKKIVLQ